MTAVQQLWKAEMNKTGARRLKVHVSRHEVERRRRGLTAQALATAVGYAHYSSISHVERRTLPASASYRQRVSSLFQLDESELFDEQGYAR